MAVYGTSAEKQKVDRILKRYEQLKRDKEPWIPSYELIGEYVMTRKQSFYADVTPGQFLTGQIFDDTAPYANHLLASSLLGALYPNGARTFSVESPDELDESERTEEVRAWYEKVTRRLVDVMDEPTAGLMTSLEEYMLDQGSFGISGVGAFEQDDDIQPVRFTAIDVKKMAIDEGANGFVDTVYIEREFTLKQLAEEFGEDMLAPEHVENLRKGELEKKVRVLHAIEPRRGDYMGTFGNRAMPIASIHIDLECKCVLRESGYSSLPVFVTRFWKGMGEKYGRSPAFECMATIVELNAAREAMTIATEKQLDPTIIVNDDSILGNGTIDTSAGSILVRRSDARMGDKNRPAAEPLYTVGDMGSTKELISELREVIMNAFFIDRLLDMNNDQRMTLGEANIRNLLRGQSLVTIYARQIAELFKPLVERVFNILLARGEFGYSANNIENVLAPLNGTQPNVIPEAVMDLMRRGRNAYKVQFISPAARIMRMEELQGIQQTLTLAAEVASQTGDMSIMDNVDVDAVMRCCQELAGAPSKIIRGADSVAKIRAFRAQQQAQAAALEAAKTQSETAKNSAKAASEATKAGPLAGAFLGNQLGAAA